MSQRGNRSEESFVRAKFLVESKTALTEKLEELNGSFRAEVAKLQKEIAAARKLRGESVEIPEELCQAARSDDSESRKAATEKINQLIAHESEAVKKLTTEAAQHPLKGQHLRELSQKIEEVEAKLERVEQELSQLRGR